MDVQRRLLAEVLRRFRLARVADELAQIAAPCVRIACAAVGDDGDIAVGGSKFGGRPDLPVGANGFAWPTRGVKPLAFLCQLRLADVAALDASGTLPSSGYVWFFYDVAGSPWGFDPADRDGWTVKWADVERDALARAEPPASAGEDADLRPCALLLEAALSLPSELDARDHALELTDDEEEALDELTQAGLDLLCYPKGIDHRLLGYPNAIQNDAMERECQLVSSGIYCGDESGAEAAGAERVRDLSAGAGRWRLLLQLDSDEEAGMMWGDGGMLYFWIPEEALAARRFDEVWTILQCY